jgi:hypothetical protein
MSFTYTVATCHLTGLALARAKLHPSGNGIDNDCVNELVNEEQN